MRSSPDMRRMLVALALAVALASAASAEEAANAPKPPANVNAGPNAAKPAAAATNAKKAKAPAKPAVDAKNAKPSVRLAATNGAGAPVVVPVTPAGGPAPGSTLAHLDDHLTYQYNALGRRDPFQALVGGGFVPMDQGGEAPPDIGGLRVVGVVWGATDQFALVEDARGSSFVLRKGDKVMNGFVEGLKRDGVIVNVTADGQSQTVVIPLTKKGDPK